MKPKPKIKDVDLLERIRVPLFDTDLWVSISEDIETTKVGIHVRIPGPEMLPASRRPRALCAFNDDNGTCVLFFERKTICVSYVAHEVSHFVSQLTTWKQFRVRAGDDEIAAMLQGWATAEVMKLAGNMPVSPVI